jgi:hypothetical protein
MQLCNCAICDFKKKEMEKVSINKTINLSEHLASPSEAALSHSSELNGLRLTPHFSLGEVTKSKHAEIYNIPSHVAIENLKRVCKWLEELRRRYNLRYVSGSVSPPELGGVRGGLNEGMPGASSDHPAHTGTPPNLGGEIDTEEPIVINSGYRSLELNKKVGGSPTSNHLTGCAVDIRVAGIEQAMRYAVILMDYADETKQDYDELLIERNRSGGYWLHFAVRPKDNRRKTMVMQL